MPPPSAPMTPKRYIELLTEYDAIVSEACSFSHGLTGKTVSEKHLSYAETIFTKLVCHALSLRRLSPTLQPTSPSELWDIGAACAIARSLVEAFDALAYIGFHKVSAPERQLRILVWELHGQEHRLVMLDKIGATGPDIERIRDSTNNLRSLVIAHSMYEALPKHVRGKISGGQTPAFLKAQKDCNFENGVNHDYYNSVIMFLSQYVHTLPFSLSQLTLAHAGDPGALQIIAMPLQYAMAFIALAISGMRELWPDVEIHTTQEIQLILDNWSELAAKGVKGLGI